MKDEMFESLEGKNVLITGASGDIGRVMAKLFASYGAVIGIHYNSNEEKAKKLLEEIKFANGKAELLKGDLLDKNIRETLIDVFIKQFGKIDILINNAGAVYDYSHFSETDENIWDKTFDINLKAPFYLVMNAFKHMKDKGGRIINISSVNVKFGGSSKSLAYVSSKAALESLTRGFAHEGAQHKILVNTIRSGVIDTNMRTKIKGYSEILFKKRIELIPLKRPGQPIDIARMALFLASKGGDFITGETLTISGGE